AGFTAGERVLARLLAHQVGLALRAFGDGEGQEPPDGDGTLELAGEALAAGAEELRTAEQVTRLAAEAMGAEAALLWQANGEEDDGPKLVGSFGDREIEAAVAGARAAAARALEDPRPVTVETRLGKRASATILLGQPPVGALQLLFAADEAPGEEEPARPPHFGVRGGRRCGRAGTGGSAAGHGGNGPREASLGDDPPRPAAGGRSAASLRGRRGAGGGGARAPLDLRRPGGARAPRRRAGADTGGGAGADARAPRRRRPGDRAAL